jgi:hypothetical protein
MNKILPYRQKTKPFEEKIMKKFVIVLLFTAFVPFANASELKIKGYIKTDRLQGDNHFLIYNKNGKTTGRIAPDPLWPSSSSLYLIFDKKGNQTGRIRPDYLDKRRYIIEIKK